MLTPIDIQTKEFKGGIGFDKKEVEMFISQVSSDYEILYRSNVELKDKVATLNESLQHYRAIEESMQKALTLSEKTAEETVSAASDKARLLNAEAEKKAEAILEEANNELQDIKDEIYRLQQQHAKYKEQFKKMLEAQEKIMDGEMIDIDLGADFEPSYQDRSYYSGGYAGDSGLSGLGGAYTGSATGGFERTSQSPTFDRGPLNMDPFEDARNGGGRFSRQTGKAYVSNSKNKKQASNQPLNVKKVKETPKTQFEEPEIEISFARPDESVKPTPKPTVSYEPYTEKAFHEEEIEDTYSGEVEDKVNESTMLDSMDNYTDGFDFISEDFSANTYSGEVENKTNESNMLDSEDNYSDGFNFMFDDSDDEDDIPTIFPKSSSENDNAEGFKFL